MKYYHSKLCKTTRVIVAGLVIIGVLTGCGENKNSAKSTKSTTSSMETSSRTTKSVNDSKKEQEAKIKEMETKYEPILKSGKDYGNMTNEEGKVSNELIDNWNKLSEEFKNKYKNEKDKLEKSIEVYNKAKKAEEESASYNTGITYDQLARTPDDYNGKKVRFSGKVVQVMEDKSETDLRIAINGNYDTILLVAYNPGITNKRVLENDNITIKGVSKGLYTYESTMGAKITLPLVIVNNIQIN